MPASHDATVLLATHEEGTVQAGVATLPARSALVLSLS
jgi:hypothetical protein